MNTSFTYFIEERKNYIDMNDKWEVLKGVLSTPVGIAKRRLHLNLFKSERMEMNNFNDWLYHRIIENKPTAVVRFGETEMRSLKKYAINNAYGKNKSYSKEVARLCKHAGFFPEDESLIDKYCEYNIENMNLVDAIGAWDLPMERYYIKKYMCNPIQTELGSLEPYYSKNPWSAALNEKKVLVVHPFSESIMKQYSSNRKRLFDDKKILPEFELKCFKAVQSMGGVPDGDYKDWFEALEYMDKEISKMDFDVAIIGCGAYGMPLALRIKKKGKIAIHLGGATQMLFGVYGKRWKDSPYINEFWIRPGEKERSINYNQVEEGCYW